MDKVNTYLKNCLYFTSARLHRVMVKITEEEFHVTGLSPTYASLLLVVNDNDGITQKELGEILHIAPSTITRFIEKLYYKDLIYKRQEGRNTIIYASPKGKELQTSIEQAFENLHKRYSAILGEVEGKELTKHLYEVSDLLEGGNS